MNEKAIYHYTRVENDTNGNPQYKFNVYVMPSVFKENENGRVLRLVTSRLSARFSKKHDAYVIKYHGNESQTEKLIESLISGAGYDLGVIA